MVNPAALVAELKVSKQNTAELSPTNARKTMIATEALNHRGPSSSSAPISSGIGGWRVRREPFGCGAAARDNPLLFEIGLIIDSFSKISHFRDILAVVDHLSLLLLQRCAQFDLLLDLLRCDAFVRPVVVELELGRLNGVALLEWICQRF